LAEGIAIPYGLYDPGRNEGFVSVGTSANTAEFAVAAVLWWWRTYGQQRYAGAPELLLLADGGSSNGCRVHLWKYSLQAHLVNRTGLQVTVCHYPTGASKWNPVEHRLFGPVSKNWEGYPLFSYDRLLRCIRGTTTDKGLQVFARMDWHNYETKKKVTAEQQETINLCHHRVLPHWNYTIEPDK
jgi:hypothetical protein